MPTIGTKFKVDGEKEYKQALSQIAASTRELDSEMRKVKTQFSENETSMEALTAKGEVYEKQVANQREKIETLQQALKNAATGFGETDKRTIAWRTSLNNAESELIKLERQMEDNNRQIKAFGDSAEESGSQMSGLEDLISQIADNAKVLDSELGLVKAQFSENANSIQALTAKGEVYEKQVANQRERVATLEMALKEAAERYGETDKRTKQWQASLNNAESELIDMERDLESNTEALEHYGEATEETASSTAGLGDIMQSLADKVGVKLPDGLVNSANSLGSFNTKVLAFSAGIGAAAAAIVKAEQAMIDMTKQAAEAASKIIDLSSTVNMSVESVQTWDYVFKSVGSSIEDAQGDLSSLQEKMREATDETSETAKLFEELGVSVQNTDGSLRNVDDVMYDVIQSLSEMEDKTNRNAISSELLGGTGEKLAAIYDQQAGTLDALIAKKEENGIATEEELTKLDSLNASMGDLRDRTDVLKTKLAAEFAPYLENATNKLSDFVTGLGDDFEESGIVDSFGSILESSSGLLAPLGQIVETILPAVTVAIEMVAAAVELIAKALSLCIEKLEEFTTMFVNFVAQYADSPLFQPIFGTSTQFTGGQLPQDAFNYQTQNGGVQTNAGVDLDQWMQNMGIVNVTVDAKNVKEFNDVINTARNAQVQARMYGMG